MDPKGGPMDDLLRGLSQLGPALNDLVGQVGDLEKKLCALSSTVATKASAEALEEVSTGLKSLTCSAPSAEEFRAVELQIAKLCRESVTKDEWQELRRLASDAATLQEQRHEEITRSIPSQASFSDLEQRCEEVSRAIAAIPSKESFTQLANEVERMAKLDSDIFNQLEATRDMLHGKADKNTVPCLEDFDGKGILLKANRIEVPTFDQVPTLIQSQFDSVDSRLKNNEVSLMGNLDELKAVVAAKAEKDNVPSMDELQDLRAELSQKIKACDASVLSSNFVEEIAKKADAVAMAQLSKRLDQKADQKWAQESIRSLSDILLPVARAVRGLPAVPGKDGTP